MGRSARFELVIAAHCSSVFTLDQEAMSIDRHSIILPLPQTSDARCNSVFSFFSLVFIPFHPLFRCAGAFLMPRVLTVPLKAKAHDRDELPTRIEEAKRSGVRHLLREST